MAALTQGAIDGLLGVLAKAITDEARLIGGVPGDMQFIKDEMDSMNGFLLHLTKTEGQHDDQVRAWMKQVREIAYVAEDCVQRYVHDIVPFEAIRFGRLGTMVGFLRNPKKYYELHNLGKQITELKARVRDVGERRLRYGVTVPAGTDLKLAPMTPAAGQQEEKREAFVRALDLELEQDVVGSKAWWRAHHQAWLRSSLRRATTAVGGLLPAALPSAVLRYLSFSREIVRRLPPLVQSEAATVHGILKKCSQDDGDDGAAFRCTKKMFLCALYAYPYATNQELEKLKEKLEGRTQEPKKEVMIFCYSMLSISQKSCLQYLTAFLHESEISRTSMVRRWVAEGLVGKEPGGGGGGGRIPEEEGECCFGELVFRGFIRPARFSDAGTVKSCVMEKPVREFILSITGSENFEVSLPAHLDRQLRIREIVRRLPPPQQEQRQAADRWRNIARRCNLCSDSASPEEDHPMDALVHFLKKLPELYRLNVLDLGGCRGLKKDHLKSFGDVVWLKYLSLRNTDVSHLPACYINKLTLLETLDIRGTTIRPRDTKKINLPKLKHLLAGRYLTPGEKASLITVRMPRKIGSMRFMETLSHVQVSKDGTELRGVAKLRQLRKLGVVVHGDADSTAHLGRVLHALSGCLRSLSVCVTTQGWALDEVSSSSSTTQEMVGAAPRPSFILENLDIKGKISGLPSWITKAQKLANVTLRNTELSGEDAMRRLASVLSLRCLKLSGGAFTEQELVFRVLQFKALKILVLEGGPITTVTFLAADAAPALEKIVWAIGRSRVRDGEDLIVGINYLPNLKAIELRGDFKTTSLVDWVEATKESTSDPRYYIRYMSSTASVGNELITEVPKTARHTTVSIPVTVINQQH
ncbi:hypothetical protein SEVIR_5G006300v4 [Setaria viridis]|uniref:Uncharacterized protein n=1 Tax=Setaria viridis TaxID=4556 RepID=A0A4U6UC00_SETVI|nr:disease resistance protein Pik-2-like [Setaria viridis]TKW11964.1 hypothetical protein SEVIR_5G006300v2 [Setaria viridis]